jgi:hypothetical protein
VPSPAPWHTFETPPKLNAGATKVVGLSTPPCERTSSARGPTARLGLILAVGGAAPSALGFMAKMIVHGALRCAAVRS